MTIILSDHEIQSYIREIKPLSANWRKQIKFHSKPGHTEGKLEVRGDAGSEFRIILRQSRSNQLDFSVIFAFCPPSTTRIFRLRRYNGKSHAHTNRIEKDQFYDFHIHVATERYQKIGAREDAYAEPTGRYSDIGGALDCLLEDMNLIELPNPQDQLF